MPDLPKELLRCPLPEKWREEDRVSAEEQSVLNARLQRGETVLFETTVGGKSSSQIRIDDLESWLQRIEPLIKALVDSADNMYYEEYGEIEATIGSFRDYRAARQAFLEGLKGEK